MIRSCPELGVILLKTAVKTDRQPTNGLFGKVQPLTKLKPPKAQRRLIPGST